MALGGRVLSALGEPRDELPAVEAEATPILRHVTTDLTTRRAVSEQLYTGLAAIDALQPIGCGQRVAFVGDKGTGKRRAVLDVIINQSGSAHCIYALVGQSAGRTQAVVETLRAAGALEHTTVIAATAEESWTMQCACCTRPMLGALCVE